MPVLFVLGSFGSAVSEISEGTVPFVRIAKDWQRARQSAHLLERVPTSHKKNHKSPNAPCKKVDDAHSSHDFVKRHLQ